MSPPNPLPLGLRLRRARLAAGLSQAELARRAQVSQPLVSHYERSLGEPQGQALTKLAAALKLKLSPESSEARAAIDHGGGSSRGWLDAARKRLLSTLEDTPLRIAVFDRPLAGAGGDLAFAVKTRSHLMVAVIDGMGSGEPATVGALVCAASLLGIAHATRGIAWPDEILAAFDATAKDLGSPRLTATTLALLDLRHAELSWSASGAPAALLRNAGDVGPLRGERAGALESGRVTLHPDWILLLATDGVAHLPSRSGDALWASPATRRLVRDARTPQELMSGLSAMLGRRGSDMHDDALAIAMGAP